MASMRKQDGRRATLQMSYAAKLFKDTLTVDDEFAMNVSETKNRPFPRHLFPDDDLDAYVDRMNGLEKLLIARGAFSRTAAKNILVDSKAKTKERAAAWLSKELRRLRELERVTGSAPVLTGSALSRLVISDLAVTMLQFLTEAPGVNLICLLQELLDVDRHRSRLAAEPGEAYLAAVKHDARMKMMERSCGVNQLARLTGVNPSTVSRWRRLKSYPERVEEHIRYLQECLRYLILEQEEQGLTRVKAIEKALAVEDARFELSKHRRELFERLRAATSAAQIHQIWRRHLAHPIEWRALLPARRDRVIDLFRTRLAELKSSAH